MLKRDIERERQKRRRSRMEAVKKQNEAQVPPESVLGNIFGLPGQKQKARIEF